MAASFTPGLLRDARKIQIVPLVGAATPETLTFVPGWYLTDDVLHDGRILFETSGDLWTVYPDGTGVETIRCDHGPQRANARQVASGDVIFNVGKRLARFTPPSPSRPACHSPIWKRRTGARRFRWTAG